MPYKLALFDFDGTLADSFPWFLQVFDELAVEFNLPKRTRAEYEAARAYDTAGILKVFGLPMWKLPRFVVRLRTLAARDYHQIPLFPGIPEMLQALHNGGVTIGMVSSNGEQVIRNVLGPDLSKLIAVYACGASMFGKASKLRTALRRTGIPGGQAIYIGDELRDATAAREARMAFGAVSWGYADPSALASLNPAAMFPSVESIALQLVKQA